MNQTSIMWFRLYGQICIGLLLLLGLWGMRDRVSLAPLLKEGGSIESLPAVFLVLASVLSLAVALRLCQKKQCYKGWFLYSGLCLFLTGEEAGWGQESILGWQVLPHTDDKWDIHNWVLGLVEGNLGIVEWNVLFGITLLSVGMAVLLGTLVLLFKKRSTTALCWSIGDRLPQTFFFLGIVLIVLANFFDALDITQLFMKGRIGLIKWALEESLELLASVAFLFAVLSRIHEEVLSRRNGLIPERLQEPIA